MILKFLSIAAVLVASCIVMILHEIPKTVLFFSLSKRKNLGAQIIKCFQFIDPIGLIFCVTSFCGFSKSYMLRAKEDKHNLILGIAGLTTLFLTAVLGFLGVKFGFRSVTMDENLSLFLFMVCQYISIISMGMFVVNLFPVAAFDMGLIIAGVSREKYFSIIRNDYFIKMILVLCLLLGVIRTLTVNGFLFLYQL